MGAAPSVAGASALNLTASTVTGCHLVPVIYVRRPPVLADTCGAPNVMHAMVE